MKLSHLTEIRQSEKLSLTKAVAGAGPESCGIGWIHFPAGWHKRQLEPGFSFAYVCGFSNCCLGFYVVVWL